MHYYHFLQINTISRLPGWQVTYRYSVFTIYLLILFSTSDSVTNDVAWHKYDVACDVGSQSYSSQNVGIDTIIHVKSISLFFEFN